jgi:hypothetical protein
MRFINSLAYCKYVTIGPDSLSVYNNKDKRVIPTLVTSMFDNKIIDKNVFSIYFKPVTDQDFKNKRINGELVFGGGKGIAKTRKRGIEYTKGLIYI